MSVITDAQAQQILQEWRGAFPDAAILPVIGYPSNNKGVVTITHTMGDGKLLNINGLASRSPLANNALYSSELSGGKYLNLYEIMLPDIPGVNGAPSTVTKYVNALSRNGLDVAGVHFHWLGSSMGGPEKLVAAIHHQNIGLDPLDFSRKTIQSIQAAMNGGVVAMPQPLVQMSQPLRGTGNYRIWP